MEVCRGHGEEELLITGVEDGAEEKVLKKSMCALCIFGVSKCDKKLCSFSNDSISVKNKLSCLEFYFSLQTSDSSHT